MLERRRRELIALSSNTLLLQIVLRHYTPIQTVSKTIFIVQFLFNLHSRVIITHHKKHYKMRYLRLASNTTSTPRMLCELIQ